MRHFIPAAFMVLPVLAGISCSPKEKEPEGPTILKLSPASKSSEPCLAHEVTFTVTCDGEFEIALEDQSWASVKSIGEPKNGASTLTLALADNTGKSSRTQTITVTGGKLTASSKLTQLALGDVLPADKVELVNMVPTSQTWKFPGSWTTSCHNSDGSSADWFSVVPESGIQNLPVETSISASSINTGSDAREGYIEIKLGSLAMKVGIVQAPADINGEIPGIYNYDGMNAGMAYDELAHQYSKLTGTTGTFRMISPDEFKFWILSGLPQTFSAGDAFSVHLVQNWLKEFEYTSDIDVRVHKATGDKAWLLTPEGTCFVIVK